MLRIYLNQRKKFKNLLKERKMRLKKIIESITGEGDEDYVKSRKAFWNNNLSRNYQKGGLDTPKSMKKNAIGKRTENYTVAKTKAEKDMERRFEQNSLINLKIPETKSEKLKAGESFSDYIKRKRLV
jgi:hypothetical protein